MWQSCGRYTSMRPAIEIWVDRRAPLVPIGSLMTCTVSTWPSNRIFSIGVGGDVGAVVAARFPDVGHVQEGGAFEADVDEGRLHARQDAHHLAGIDIAGQAARERALDVQFLHGALQDQRDARLLRGDVDQDVFVHGAQAAAVESMMIHGRAGSARVRRRCAAGHGSPGGIQPLYAQRNAGLAQQVRRFVQRQAHDARVAAFDMLDEQRRQALDAVAAGLVVRLGAWRNRP